jgi:hypothetical protein
VDRQIDEMPYTGYLFPNASIARAAGSVLALRPEAGPYNASDTSEEADARALFADFAAVAADVQAVLVRRQQASLGAAVAGPV